MSDVAKQLLMEMNQSLSQRLKNEFIKYLMEIEQNKLRDISERINWEPAVKLFELEYKKLWTKFIAVKTDKESGLKKEFEKILLANVKHRLFHTVYLHLKEKVKGDVINAENVNEIMDEFFKDNLYELFKVFDYQFTISSLIKNNDPHAVLKIIESLRKVSEFGNNLKESDSTKEYERVFKIIDNELERRERIGQRWSIRAACDYYAKNELNLGNNASKPVELDNFYRKYLSYRKK